MMSHGGALQDAVAAEVMHAGEDEEREEGERGRKWRELPGGGRDESFRAMQGGDRAAQCTR